MTAPNTVAELPLEVDEGDPYHAIHHELIHEALQAGPEWAPTGTLIAGPAIVLASTSTTSASGADIVGLTIVVPPTAVPALVHWGGFVQGSNDQGFYWADLYEDGEQIDRIGGSVSGANGILSAWKASPIAASSSARTYKGVILPLTAGQTARALANAPGVGVQRYPWLMYATAA